MITTHVFLALSCLLLLLVIAWQNYFVPALRNETISAGLTGKDHALLDAAYVPLAAALCIAFTDPWMRIFATIAAVALLLVAATNTAWRWFDVLTDGAHATWHSRFTLTVFVSALALQVAGDHGWWWALTALNVLVPAAIYGWFHYRATIIEGVSVQASPAAEKAYTGFLCLWLILWAL